MVRTLGVEEEAAGHAPQSRFAETARRMGSGIVSPQSWVHLHPGGEFAFREVPGSHRCHDRGPAFPTVKARPSPAIHGLRADPAKVVDASLR